MQYLERSESKLYAVSVPVACKGRETSTSDSIVIIPTYNECENITALIAAIRCLPISISVLVVDDNSPDGTAEIVSGIMQNDPGVYLLRRPGKQGLGTAYKAGFRFALTHGWKYICQMDADFSHNPDDLPKLIQKCRSGSDVVVGSRYVCGGNVEGWPLGRLILSKAANMVARILLRCKVSDMTSGFKCFKREALEKITSNEITTEGYIFQVEMIFRAKLHNLKLCQIPIVFCNRRKGSSKMSGKEVGAGIKSLIAIYSSQLLCLGAKE